MTKALGFALAAAGLIATALGIFVLAFDAAADRRALFISALLAFLIQMLGYAVARGIGGAKNMIIGWSAAAGLRFVALIIFAFVIVGSLSLPPTSATISFAVFLFVSTLIEPLFLT
ncbi:MAG: hypothetical protein ACT4OZ_02990 [Gemmatimonadota bacterium]